jgi:hypothetical protein
MSINQLTPEGKVGEGVELSVGRLTHISHIPKTITDSYLITTDDLSTQRMLIIGVDDEPITITFPSNATLLSLLTKSGDFLELTVKYRTTGTITITSVDGLFFVLFGNSYTLESGNGLNFKTAKIGVARTNVGGTLRIY